MHSTRFTLIWIKSVNRLNRQIKVCDIRYYLSVIYPITFKDNDSIYWSVINSSFGLLNFWAVIYSKTIRIYWPKIDFSHFGFISPRHLSNKTCSIWWFKRQALLSQPNFKCLNDFGKGLVGPRFLYWMLGDKYPYLPKSINSFLSFVKDNSIFHIYVYSLAFILRSVLTYCLFKDRALS